MLVTAAFADSPGGLEIAGVREGLMTLLQAETGTGREAAGVIADNSCAISAERLVRRFGGDKNPAAKKKAITAIAHTLLKIAYQVLKSGTPYRDLGADFYTRRNSPEEQQKYLERQLQRLHPGCTITITISPPEAALLPGR